MMIVYPEQEGDPPTRITESDWLLIAPPKIQAQAWEQYCNTL